MRWNIHINQPTYISITDNCSTMFRPGTRIHVSNTARANVTHWTCWKILMVLVEYSKVPYSKYRMHYLTGERDQIFWSSVLKRTIFTIGSVGSNATCTVWIILRLNGRSSNFSCFWNSGTLSHDHAGTCEFESPEEEVLSFYINGVLYLAEFKAFLSTAKQGR